MRRLSLLVLLFALAAKARGGALDTWTNVATSPYGTFDELAYGNGFFLALSFVNPGVVSPPPVLTGGVSISTNGVNWQHQPLYDFSWNSMAFGNGTFVTSYSSSDTGNTGTGSVSYSTNGTYWQSFTGSPGFPGIQQVVFGNGIFVAVGYSAAASQGVAYLSTNGQVWSSTPFNIATNFYPVSIACGQGGFVVVGGLNQHLTNNSMYFSTNGKSWTNISPVVTGAYGGIISVNNIFSASVSTNYLTLPPFNYYLNTNLSSPWTPISLPLAQVWQPALGNTSQYVAIINGTNVFSSPDDQTGWVSHVTGFTNDLYRIAYANGQFVAVGASGGIFISGIVPPSLSTVSKTNSGVQVTFSGGAGPTYHLQASTDLAAWTNLAAFTNIGVSAQYLDSNAIHFSRRYYRTISP